MSRSTITPHASHRWGLVSGERRCKVCYAAPDWPIVERECGSDVRFYDNAARDAGIVRLYQDDVSVNDIAGMYGLSRDSVSKAVGRSADPESATVLERRKRGRGPVITLAQAREAMALQTAGYSWAEIGPMLDRKPMAIKDAVRELRAGRGRLAAEAREIAERGLRA